MTKADLVEAVHSQMTITKKDAAELVDLLFELVREQLENGEEVKISGFGNFNVRSKNTRRGRNPKTGEEISITARKVMTFKPSQILKEKVKTGS
ncbi:MAG: integration host factor subunit alpha [Magnetococcales bacterium]|nr:integration host factor subunit alpha [Magnetococcales bacterium]